MWKNLKENEIKALVKLHNKYPEKSAKSPTYNFHELWKSSKKEGAVLLHEYTNLEVARIALVNAEMLDKKSRYWLCSWEVSQWENYTGKRNLI